MRRLWAAVLEAALSDAGNHRARVRKGVAGWLQSGDFWHVCECAGFDPRRTAALFRQVLAAPARARRARRGGMMIDDARLTELRALKALAD